MFHPKDFCPALNESEWKGSLCEVGMGVPFQSQFFAESGASNTILFAHSPYNKAFQPMGPTRSVSEHMSVALANNDMFKLWRLPLKGNLFSLAVTASHKRADERGDSHGWVSVSTWKDDVMETHSFHFKIRKEYQVEYGKEVKVNPVSRSFAGALYAWKIRWFLSMVLLKKWDTWGEAIDNMPRATYDTISIDVIRSPSITIEEHLKLAKQGTPLVFEKGKFQRPEDSLRKMNRIYRGSFNPPTKSHSSVGDGALFEIDISNARKGKISYEDLAHRIRMVDLTGNPTLINSGCPLFIELHRSLRERGLEDLEYLVGVDTFNDIVNKKYIPYEGFLEPFYKGGSGKLIVVPREGVEIRKDNEFFGLLNWCWFDQEYIDGCSSTSVREGDLDQVSDRVADYIRENNLYQIS